MMFLYKFFFQYLKYMLFFFLFKGDNQYLVFESKLFSIFVVVEIIGSIHEHKLIKKYFSTWRIFMREFQMQKKKQQQQKQFTVIFY